MHIFPHRGVYLVDEVDRRGVAGLAVTGGAVLSLALAARMGPDHPSVHGVLIGTVVAGLVAAAVDGDSLRTRLDRVATDPDPDRRLDPPWRGQTVQFILLGLLLAALPWMGFAFIAGPQAVLGILFGDQITAQVAAWLLGIGLALLVNTVLLARWQEVRGVRLVAVDRDHLWRRPAA
ncbi:MAG: hypothetical protein U0Y82_00300 [Thermoleophilia bacterium]